MKDCDCVEFLQWALPVMRMRWPGFRKVRGQVCKRISRRIDALDLRDAGRYRAYLEAHPQEWRTLASLCRITISRFYRDKRVFDRIAGTVLPRLAGGRRRNLQCWSAGCASGEEAYTVQILWMLRVESSPKTLRVLGTDSDPGMLERARKAVYPASALEDLPRDLTTRAFERSDDAFVLREEFKENVRFEEQDIREAMPRGPFDAVLCRNLVFMYFEESLQRQILRKLVGRLCEGGVLVTGVHESLPANDLPIRNVAPAIYERSEA